MLLTAPQPLRLREIGEAVVVLVGHVTRLPKAAWPFRIIALIRDAMIEHANPLYDAIASFLVCAPTVSSRCCFSCVAVTLLLDYSL